jgi:hypothetical protein
MSDGASIPDTARLTRCEGGKLYQTCFICSHLWLGTSDEWMGFSQVNGEVYNYVCLSCFHRGPAVDDETEKHCFHCVQEKIAARRVTPVYLPELPSWELD